MDNNLLILLLLLVSAYIQQGESGYVPESPAAHGKPFRCDIASFLIFAHILHVIKYNAADGVQHYNLYIVPLL